MNDLTIIITMAGMGSRFRKAGYIVPKYMIEAKGKTLFEWSMDSLKDYNPHVKKYIFIVQRKDDTKNFIKTKMTNYGIDEISIIEIDEATDGQATTCMLAIPFCDKNSPILIYNIDTYIEPGGMRYADIAGDGFIPCFNGDGDHWSFVRTNDRGEVLEVREKTRISDNCSIGAYYFSSSELYEKTYKSFYSDHKNLVNGEKYVAPMYKYLIDCGYRVTTCNINRNKIHVMGTPEELEAFLHS